MVATVVAAYLIVVVLTRNAFRGIIITIPWFVPTTDSLLIMVGTFVACFSFGRYRVLNDPLSFWTGVGFTGVAVGLSFHFLTFPNLWPPGHPVIASASPSVTARSILGGFLSLSIALLIGVVARWPSGTKLQGRHSFIFFGFWVLILVMLHTLLLVFDAKLPAMIGAGPEGSYTPTSRGLMLGLMLVTTVGAVLALQRFMRTNDALAAYVGVCQFLIIPISAIVPGYFVRYGIWWYLQFISMDLGFILVLFGLLNEYVALFQREQDKTHALQEREMRLQSALAVRNEFIAIASHELKTPLTALKLRAQAFHRCHKKSQKNDGVGLDAFCDRLVHSVNQLVRLVDDMLDFSRVSSGRLSLEKRDVDLGLLVRGMIDQLSNELERSGCAVQLMVDDDIIGFWDRSRIEQVVANLLTNSMKYGARASIEVRVKKGGDDSALVEISDHGMGIAREDQERVFQQFERAISVTNVSGLGLGLFIARNIVRDHGGDISVESELGKGATFRVRLPLFLNF